MKKNELIITLIITIILSFFTIITLNKKNDYNEITQGAYVSSIGIDYDLSTKEFTLYLYILNNFNLGQSEFAISESKNLGYIAKGKGNSLAKALSAIKNISNIRLELSHIKSMVIKDTFFNNQNLLKLIDFIKYNPGMYPNFVVYVTSNGIKEIFTVQNFTETSAYYTLLVNSKGINLAKQTTFTNLINDLLHQNYTESYPVISSNTDTIFDKEDNYNTLEITGFGFITNNSELSIFNYSYLNGLKYLNPLSKSILSYDNYDYQVYEYYKKIKVKNNTLIINITIHGKIISNRLNNNSIELIERFKEDIKKDIITLKSTMDNYSIDIFNVNYLSKNKSNYKDVNLEINIKVI